MGGIYSHALLRRAQIICILLFFSGHAETLQFMDALNKVLLHNPELSIQESVIKAAEASVTQADKILNPELEIGLENLGMNEIEAAITQPLELGGKRKTRNLIADKELKAAQCETDGIRLRLHTETLRKFIPILAVHLKIECIDSILQLMEESLTGIRRRIEVGAAMQIDALRGEMEQDERILEKSALEREKRRLARELALLWGDTSDVIWDVEGELLKSVEVPEQAELEKKLSEHPKFRLLKLQQEIARGGILEAEAGAAPEAAITGGYLRNNETKENAGVLGFSMGLPIFNRNKGAIQAASYEHASVKKKYDALFLECVGEIRTVLSEIEGVDNELFTVEKKLLPKAEKIYADLYTFYNQGSASILDLLQSRQHLIETQLNSIDLLMDKALLYVDLLECAGIQIEIVK